MSLSNFQKELKQNKIAEAAELNIAKANVLKNLNSFKNPENYNRTN